MININNLCDEIISNTEKQNEIYLKMKEDYDYFEKNCYGKLNNKILSKILPFSISIWVDMPLLFFITYIPPNILTTTIIAHMYKIRKLVLHKNSRRI